MLQAYGEHRYYKRGQYRAVQMNEREVRERYERILQKRNLVDEFLRSQQLNHVARRLPQDSYRSHYVSCPSIPSENRIDFNGVTTQDWLEGSIYPGSQSYYQPFVNGVRSALVINDPRWWRPYVEIHRNGAISVWRAASIDPDNDVFAYRSELENVEAFLRYTGRWLSFIGYSGPVRLLLEISHGQPPLMQRLKFPHPSVWPGEGLSLFSHDDVLRLDIESSGMTLINEPKRALKSLGDEMFRAFGRWGADCFDSDLNLVRGY